ncbi:esterase-like activity of phytase family protein [Aquibium sp. A9E412]|uniref:esterase-like activity of phytase family protein n=1 Tax=Aquibium sp. A9E412 TaxID=2976767 RepID=UPI0025AFFEB6|nr:esterase-like activity of phytase family protein [Aquibium sp. A9E412]MDN2568419.1 esterase-like activity of phytase family protein [Aquibium sp. A9E412]
MRRTLRALALGAALAGALPAAAGGGEIAIRSRPIENFHIGSDETRFGPLRFVGGLEMNARGRDFGALSALRFRTPGETFVGVADTGFWFFGRITRDEAGRPSGVADFRMAAMVDETGEPTREKWTTDAEGLAVRDGVATVGFERAHRIADFRLDPEAMGQPFAERDFLVPAHELRRNRGFETVAHAPADGPLAGALVIVTEKSLDANGDIFAAVLDGPRKGIFSVARSDGFDITDGAFLPDGDLVLLERRFTMADGVAMRLRRIAGDAIRPDATVDGAVLLEADMRYQIDNMEALDAWQRADGTVMLSLMSDDNHSMLQRNLYLEFALVGD